MFLAALCFACDVRADAEFVQSQQIFEKAIRNRSTLGYVVLATVIDDNTGVAHTECVTGGLLLGAIHREYDLPYDAVSNEKAVQIALSSPSHVFHFSKRSAIENLPAFAGQMADGLRQRYWTTCALVKQGKSAFTGDLGPPGFDP